MQTPLWNRITVDEKDAGNHFLIRLDTTLSDTALKWLAKEQGIKLDCLSEYCVQDKESHLHTIIVNYSDLREDSFVEAMGRLAYII